MLTLKINLLFMNMQMRFQAHTMKKLLIGVCQLRWPQSSGANKPPAGQNNSIEGSAEVVSTPQLPSTNMRFDTPEEAERY
jgi:hypothetical protein